MYKHVSLHSQIKTMNKMKNLVLTLAVAIIAFTACTNSSSSATTSSEQVAAAATGKAYVADTNSSIVTWKATHKGGFAPRYGTIKVSSGDVSVDNGAVTGGSFIIDLNSLWVDSASVTEKDKKAINLQNHLKSPDFFNAEKYPTAKFVITNVAPYDSSKIKSLVNGATNLVSGNLTIKDSTINITFPAKVAVNEAGADISAKFSVDRTAWGLKYGAEGNPADWMISKDFELGIDLKAMAN